MGMIVGLSNCRTTKNYYVCDVHTTSYIFHRERDRNWPNKTFQYGSKVIWHYEIYESTYKRFVCYDMVTVDTCRRDLTKSILVLKEEIVYTDKLQLLY